MFKDIASAVSRRSRQWRRNLFLETIGPRPGELILDLGGGSGDYIASIVKDRSVVTVADADPLALRLARETYGFKTIELDGSPQLALPDKAFDIVFCSSVIEHVTGPKPIVYNTRNDAEFINLARQNQKLFAREIGRVANRYFVQTPNKWFIIETHSGLPFFVFMLPRRFQMPILKFFANFWFTDTTPDFRLLTVDEMTDFFPNANIVCERFGGFTKSIIAIGGALNAERAVPTRVGIGQTRDEARLREAPQRTAI